MEGAAQFLGQVIGALGRSGIDTAGLHPDHLCYRVETDERYQAMRAELQRLGTLLGEGLVAGRAISTYRLHRPVRWRGFAVDVVELPAPKAGSPYAEGFEHAEFVVPGGPGAFMRRHPGLAWDTSGLHKPHNPEARLHLGFASAKFHGTALAEMIAAEQRAQR